MCCLYPGNRVQVSTSASSWFQKLICLWRLLCCVIWQQNFIFSAEWRSGICRKLLKVTEYCPSDDSMNSRRNLHLQSLTTQVLCGKIQQYMAQDPQQKLSWHICLFPESRHSPQCRMSSRAGYTVAHGGRQVAPSVQVLDGPTPGLWFVHWALHSAFHTFKVKTKTKEKCHQRLNSHSRKYMDVQNSLLPTIHLHLNMG